MPNSVALRPVVPVHERREQPKVFKISLRRREVSVLEGDLRGAQIACIDSVLWVTQHGDGEDYFLQPGERFTVTLPGRVVVQGMLRS